MKSTIDTNLLVDIPDPLYIPRYFPREIKQPLIAYLILIFFWIERNPLNRKNSTKLNKFINQTLLAMGGIGKNKDKLSISLSWTIRYRKILNTIIDFPREKTSIYQVEYFPYLDYFKGMIKKSVKNDEFVLNDLIYYLINEEHTAIRSIRPDNEKFIQYCNYIYDTTHQVYDTQIILMKLIEFFPSFEFMEFIIKPIIKIKNFPILNSSYEINSSYSYLNYLNLYLYFLTNSELPKSLIIDCNYLITMFLHNKNYHSLFKKYIEDYKRFLQIKNRNKFPQSKEFKFNFTKQD